MPYAVQPKMYFKKEEAVAVSAKKRSMPVTEPSTEMHELSARELSALCTNLARGCEKQYKQEESALFNELAEYFKGKASPAEEPDFDKLLALIDKDLEEGFPNANATAAEAKDRGALRALVWSEKVTRVLKSLLTVSERRRRYV